MDVCGCLWMYVERREVSRAAEPRKVRIGKPGPNMEWPGLPAVDMPRELQSDSRGGSGVDLRRLVRHQDDRPGRGRPAGQRGLQVRGVHPVVRHTREVHRLRALLPRSWECGPVVVQHSDPAGRPPLHPGQPRTAVQVLVVT